MADSLVVYVDIDDTLIRTAGTKRIRIATTVECVRRLKRDGAELYCWSAGGAAYAREVATELGIAELFECFLPKPEVLIDDLRMDDWRMLEMHPNDCPDCEGVARLEQLLSQGRRSVS